MGPVGASGQVDADATSSPGPRQADRAAAWTIAGEEITTLPDREADPAPAVGTSASSFPVLQPPPDAQRGGRTSCCRFRSRARKPEPQWLEELLEATGARRPAASTALPSLLRRTAAARRACPPAPPHSPRGRRSSLRTSRPANLDSKTSGEILELLRNSVTTYGQTTVMVTHEAPRRCDPPTAILFLDDGLSVKELQDANAAQVLEVMSSLGS